jgi:hypothetical protein
METKYCAIHGKNSTHTTEECRTIRAIKERNKNNYKNNARINEINSEETPTNKDFSIYSSHIINPCYKKIKIKNQQHLALIDTGADISIMNKKTYLLATKQKKQEYK